MGKLEGKYEEYKRLNEEIAFYRQYVVKNQDYCVASFAVLVGFAIKEKMPLLFILSWFIIWQYWINYNHANQNIAKLSQYIATYLNGDETNLYWETRVNRDKLTNKSKYFWKTLTTPHAIMSLACFWGALYYFVVNYFWSDYLDFKIWIIVGGIIAGISLFVFNCWLAVKIGHKPWPEMRKFWRNFWKNSEDDTN